MEPDPRHADPAYAERLRGALGAPAVPRPDAEARAEALGRRAAALLEERFGPGEAASVAFAPGYAPLSAEHTAYFDGFGLLLALPDGVAVAVRPAARGVWLATEGVAEPDEVVLGDLLRELARQRALPGREAAVAVTLPPGLDEVLAGAVAAAATRALGGRGAPRSPEDALREGAAALEVALDRPVGPAYLLADRSGGEVALVDAGTLEREGMARPATEQVGWGLVATGPEPRPAPAFVRERGEALEASLARLRQGGFEGLRTLRSLEHRDLSGALGGLSGLPRRVVRYLVSEDRRVPRLWAAFQKGDGQLLGAHLLMSHAALREDWGAGSDAAAFVVEAAAEAEGVYGARAIRGGVLLVGRPFLVPAFLEHVAEGFAERFGTRPATRVL